MQRLNANSLGLTFQKANLSTMRHAMDALPRHQQHLPSAPSLEATTSANAAAPASGQPEPPAASQDNGRRSGAAAQSSAPQAITLDMPEELALQQENDNAPEGQAFADDAEPAMGAEFQAVLARMMLATAAKSQTELAERLQVSRSAISDAKNRQSAPALWFLKLSRAPYHVNPAWLETGKGSMRLPGASGGNGRPGGAEPWLEHHIQDLLNDTPDWDEAYATGGQPRQDCYHPVPLAEPLLAEIGDGLAIQPDVSPAAFLESWLKTLGEPKAMRLLPVHGDAMAPAIGAGDWVLVDESQKAVIEGDVYALRMDEQVVLRRLAKAPGELVLKCDNPRWGESLRAPAAGRRAVDVIGRVVLAVRRTV